MIINCLRCNQEFRTYACRIKINQGKYCSFACRDRRIIKTCTTCHKKFKTKSSPSRVKSGRGQYCSRNCSPSIFKKNSIPPNWKNGLAGLQALHYWVKRRRKKPLRCEFCKQIKRIYLANKSHHYKWDVNDWLDLCASCHKNYDIAYQKSLR